MWRRPRGKKALGALWSTIFHICSRFEHKLPQYPENTLDKIRLRDNVSSLHKFYQIWCTTAWIAVKCLCENIHLAADISDKSPTSCTQPSFGGRTRLIPEQWLDTEPSDYCDLLSQSCLNKRLFHAWICFQAQLKIKEQLNIYVISKKRQVTFEAEEMNSSLASRAKNKWFSINSTRPSPNPVTMGDRASIISIPDVQVENDVEQLMKIKMKSSLTSKCSCMKTKQMTTRNVFVLWDTLSQDGNLINSTYCSAPQGTLMADALLACCAVHTELFPMELTPKNNIYSMWMR